MSTNVILRVSSIYDAFQTCLSVLRKAEIRIQRDQVELYTTPDGLVRFRAGMDKKQMAEWTEDWKVSKHNPDGKRFSYQGMKINETPMDRDAFVLNHVGASLFGIEWARGEPSTEAIIRPTRAPSRATPDELNVLADIARIGAIMSKKEDVAWPVRDPMSKIVMPADVLARQPRVNLSTLTAQLLLQRDQFKATIEKPHNWGFKLTPLGVATTQWWLAFRALEREATR